MQWVNHKPSARSSYYSHQPLALSMPCYHLLVCLLLAFNNLPCVLTNSSYVGGKCHERGTTNLESPPWWIRECVGYRWPSVSCFLPPGRSRWLSCAIAADRIINIAWLSINVSDWLLTYFKQPIKTTYHSIIGDHYIAHPWATLNDPDWLILWFIQRYITNQNLCTSNFTHIICIFLTTFLIGLLHDILIQ